MKRTWKWMIKDQMGTRKVEFPSWQLKTNEEKSILGCISTLIPQIVTPTTDIKCDTTFCRHTGINPFTRARLRIVSHIVICSPSCQLRSSWECATEQRIISTYLKSLHVYMDRACIKHMHILPPIVYCLKVRIGHLSSITTFPSGRYSADSTCRCTLRARISENGFANLIFFRITRIFCMLGIKNTRWTKLEWPLWVTVLIRNEM